MTIIDYDLHGFVGIRLLDASPREVAAITRDLGPIQKTLTREPDILIRFVDHLSLSTPVRYLGLDDAGFTDHAFLVLRSKQKSRARVQIPFDKIGRQCEIICERGLSAVPLLIPILNLTALGKGILPLHASAFDYQGTGVVVTGWAKGGKTETLLAFARNGADYIGDEWIYLSSDGRYMYGIPEPIRLWDWQLQDLPEYSAQITRADRGRLRMLRMLVSTLKRIESNGQGPLANSAPLVRRVIHQLQWQQNVRVAPQKLFRQGFGSLVGHPKKVFFVTSHEASEVRVEPVDPEEVARRMVFSLQAERIDLLSYYLKFRFAFPDASNALIDQLEEYQRELLSCILKDKDTYSVYHPYPVHIPSLFDAISPFCNQWESAKARGL